MTLKLLREGKTRSANLLVQLDIAQQPKCESLGKRLMMKPRKFQHLYISVFIYICISLGIDHYDLKSDSLIGEWKTDTTSFEKYKGRISGTSWEYFSQHTSHMSLWMGRCLARWFCAASWQDEAWVVLACRVVYFRGVYSSTNWITAIYTPAITQVHELLLCLMVWRLLQPRVGGAASTVLAFSLAFSVLRSKCGVFGLLRFRTNMRNIKFLCNTEHLMMEGNNNLHFLW